MQVPLVLLGLREPVVALDREEALGIRDLQAHRARQDSLVPPDRWVVLETLVPVELQVRLVLLV